MARKRWIQDRHTGKLIPEDEYQPPSDEKGHMILPDIEPFVSPVDGSVVSSRSKLRAHNRKHGVTNIADYGPDWAEKAEKSRQQRLALQTKRQKQHRVEQIKAIMESYGY